jgi:hypothetical protein
MSINRNIPIKISSPLEMFLFFHKGVLALLAQMSEFTLRILTCSGKSRVLTSSIVVVRYVRGDVYHYVFNVSSLFPMAHQFDVIGNPNPHPRYIVFKPRGRKFISQQA